MIIELEPKTGHVVEEGKSSEELIEDLKAAIGNGKIRMFVHEGNIVVLDESMKDGFVCEF